MVTISLGLDVAVRNGFLPTAFFDPVSHPASELPLGASTRYAWVTNVHDQLKRYISAVYCRSKAFHFSIDLPANMASRQHGDLYGNDRLDVNHISRMEFDEPTETTKPAFILTCPEVKVLGLAGVSGWALILKAMKLKLPLSHG